MKGGENLGLNNSDLGNIILSLTNFEFYIKLQANTGVKFQTSDADGEIYYFIFDLTTSNNFVTEYGLFKDLLLNGNKPTILSKTFSEMKVTDKEESKVNIKGKAYKKMSTSNKESTVKFNESEGKDATLTIQVDTKYVPFYKLVIDGVTPVNPAFDNPKKYYAASISSINDECNVQNILQNFKNAIVSKSGLKEYNENDIDNKKKLYLMLVTEEMNMKCINSAVYVFEKQAPEENELNNLKELYDLLMTDYDKFLFANTNYLISDPDNQTVPPKRFNLTPDIYQTVLGRIGRLFKFLQQTKSSEYPGIDFSLIPIDVSSNPIYANFTKQLNDVFKNDEKYSF
jgi:hypothetical protein